MGQQEVIEVLEKSETPLSRREIAEKIKAHPNLVSLHLRKLLLHGEVKCKEVGRKKANTIYKSKRRLRVYYLE